MGSSYFAGLYGAVLLNLQGVPATAIEASGSTIEARALLQQAALWILISQSGQSPEVVRLARWVERTTTVLSITNDVESPLAEASDVILPLLAGSETATTSSTYTNTLGLLAVLAGWDIKALTRAAREMDEALAAPYDSAGPTSDVLTVIGRGLSLTSAHQTALILREGAHLTATAYSGGAFRHGPLEWVGPGKQFIVFMGSEPHRAMQQRLVTDITNRGANVFTVGDSPNDSWRAPAEEPALGPLIEILPMERFMVAAAEARGLVPGELSAKVTQQE